MGNVEHFFCPDSGESRDETCWKRIELRSKETIEKGEKTGKHRSEDSSKNIILYS
jgi:hypothetical protein